MALNLAHDLRTLCCVTVYVHTYIMLPLYLCVLEGGRGRDNMSASISMKGHRSLTGGNL